MIEWLKGLEDFAIKLIGALTILGILPLFNSIYLDQYIMLLTLFGLMVNNLGKQHLLYKIRLISGEILIFLAKSVCNTCFGCFIFLLAGLGMMLIFHLLGLYEGASVIFSSSFLPYLFQYVLFVSVMAFLFYKISVFISKSENNIDENQQHKIYNTIYYAFLFTTYSINFTVRTLL